MSEYAPRLQKQKTPFPGFDSLALKSLGLVCTMAGTALALFFDKLDVSTPRMLLQMVSYIAMPIFAFFVSEGVRQTGRFRNYLLRLLGFGLLCEIPFDLVFQGKWWDIGQQNALFSLAIAAMTLYAIRKTEQRGAWGFMLKALVTVAGLLWAVFLQTQYGTYLVMTTVFFYLFRENKPLRYLLIGGYSFISYLTPEIGLIPLAWYNGERGKYPKYLFYILYTAQLAAAAALRLMMG